MSQQSEGDAYSIERGEGPVVACAIHAGHAVRPEVEVQLALDEDERLREEDPHTDAWVDLAPTRVVAHRSRFEVDLNRPRERAVYRRPEDAWGLEVWKEGSPDEGTVVRSLAWWDRFYRDMAEVLAGLERRHGRFVVYDLHSYNHRRGGPGAEADDPEANPDVNLGTGTMDRGRWEPVVDAFLDTLSDLRVEGEPLDVRENVRFRGGHFVDWVHRTFPDSGCALAVEVKKTFMDEWSGEVHDARLAAIGRSLADTVEPVRRALDEA